MSKKILLTSSIAAITAGLIFVACAPFQDSPFSDQLLNPSRDLNLKSQSEISGVEDDGIIRMAIFSDPHQNYKSLDQVIDGINRQTGVDFGVILGDITNSGYNLEYDQFLDSFTSLKVPTVTVIGNHDAIGAGPELYKKAFGPTNFWFESANKRYIFFNSANKENPQQFDAQWVKDAVDSSTKNVILFSHCPMKDPERFADPATSAIFDAIIADPKVSLVLNGHNHVYNLTLNGSTVMLQSPRTEGGQWLLLEIQGTNLTVKRMDTGETTSVTLKN